jgi:hypothetical protein
MLATSDNLMLAQSGGMNVKRDQMDKDRKKRASAGGKARSAALSAAEKKAIASNAATERWARQRGLPKETHTGVLRFGPGIACSVLSNGMRVLSLNGLGRAFGSKAKGQRKRDQPTRDQLLPPVLGAANLAPFLGEELRAKLANPIQYRGMHGGRVSIGHEADILSKMCNVLLDARAAGALRKSQMPIAAAAEIMMRGFAHVGLVALIDEATGFQADRARDELHRILEQYISKELLPWTKKFPDEFFQQVYRVHGWKYEPGNTQRPGYVGKFINRFVYEQLPDGVLDKLRDRNPPINGHRRHKHFQFLTDHTGDPHLDRQIVATTTVMKIADGKDDFEVKFRRAFPKRGDQQTFTFPAPPPDDPTSAGALVVVTGGTRGMTLEALQHGNTVATKDLARRVYASGSAATLNKMRKFLNRLRDEDLVESPSPGLWRRRSPD